jgi:hypothetical protein
MRVLLEDLEFGRRSRAGFDGEVLNLSGLNLSGLDVVGGHGDDPF